MVTYRDTKGNAVELPKLTLGISDKMDAVGSAQSNRERYRLQYEFVKEVCGEECAAQALDGEDIDDIDLVALNVVYVGIVNAYAAPAAKAQAEGIAEQMKALKPMVGAADAVGRIAVMGNSRQGFKAVR
jgi:hypothetical protein